MGGWFLPDRAGWSRLLIRVPQKTERFRLMSSESLRSSMCTECHTPLVQKTKYLKASHHSVKVNPHHLVIEGRDQLYCSKTTHLLGNRCTEIYSGS